MSMTSESLSYAIDELTASAAFDSFSAEPFFVPSLFTMTSSSGYRELVASFSALGQFQAKTPGAVGSESEIKQEFRKEFIHQVYSLVVPAERELLEDNRFGLAARIGSGLGESAAYTMEKHGAAMFAAAFTTTLAEDGLSLCNTAHLNAAGGNSQSNSGTAALSMANIAAARVAMRRFKNYNGDDLPSNPNALLVPPDLEETAWEIVRSTNRPDVTNLTANMYNGMFALYVWEKMGTDTNDWFMLDLAKLKKNLLWLMRVPLEIFTDLDQFTGRRRFGGYMRYSYGALDWRGIYGNVVA